MKQSKTMFFNLLLIFATIFFQSCGSDDSDPLTQIDLITSSGNTITMTGNWQSPCADLNGNSIKEVFSFDGTKATVDIDFFSGSGCQGNPTQNLVVLLDIKSIGSTYSVTLNGQLVTATKISGNESIQGQAGSEGSFKQAFYIDDSGTSLVMYHGIFGDDGGAVNADGFPLELHNIGIVKL